MKEVVHCTSHISIKAYRGSVYMSQVCLIYRARLVNQDCLSAQYLQD